MTKYRILSLDGGGVRGLITLVVLQRLKQAIPTLIKSADLLAGTSTGGFIAIGLAKGLSPTALRYLYEEKSPEIFADTRLDDLADLWGLTGAEYDQQPLKQLLQKVLGNTTLNGLKKKVLIPAFDLDNEKPGCERGWSPKFFHNFEGTDCDGERLASEVALYTSAAPTYFPAAGGYIDGGVCANNPSMAALAQTQDPRADIPNRPAIDEIVLLSIGSGHSSTYIAGQNLDWGKLQWARPLFHIMLDGGMGIADYQCRQLLRDRYHRISFHLPPGENIQLDDWQKTGRLIEIGANLNLGEAEWWLKTYWV